jgi:hypothetical protein
MQGRSRDREVPLAEVLIKDRETATRLRKKFANQKSGSTVSDIQQGLGLIYFKNNGQEIHNRPGGPLCI